MTKKVHLNLDIRHLTRIEGHANIRVRVNNGRLEEASWDVVETPRFFEVMLKGKHYTTAGILTARICGICSISHCLASLRATENGFGLVIPKSARDLRLLAQHGETLQSHLLHLFFLAAPDFLSVDSSLALIKNRPDIIDLAVRLKGTANRICEIVAGRMTHPLSLQVGGVSMKPDLPVLEMLRKELLASLEDLAETVDLVKSFQVPDFLRETEYVSLKGESDYPFTGGMVVSSDGVLRAEEDYKEITNEYVVPDSTSKQTKLSRESYAVGPLARFNNNHEFLHPEALEAADRLGLEPVCHNPFMAHAARVAECVHCVHDSIRLIDALSSGSSEELMVPVEPRAGRGTGAVEAPRGILFHSYEYNAGGRIMNADCVVPTTQNNASIRQDLDAMVRHLVDAGTNDRELERVCCMLVRSYDPCISCSVH